MAGLDRDHLMQVAQQGGHGAQFLDMLSDEQLASCVADMAGRMLGGGTPGSGSGNGDLGADTGLDDLGGDDLGDLDADAGAAPPMPDAGQPDASDSAAPAGRDQMIGELVAMGEDEQALQTMDDQALQELYLQKKGGAGGMPAPTMMGEQQRGKQAARPQVIQLSARTLDQLIEGKVKAAVARTGKGDRTRRISEFCERMVIAGKLTPAQVEVDSKGKTIGPIRARLERASAVARFGEGDSELALQMAEIEAGPTIRTPGERIRQGPGGTVGAGGLSPERRAAILSGSSEGRAILKLTRKA